jgi:hypothetical protein
MLKVMFTLHTWASNTGHNTSHEMGVHVMVVMVMICNKMLPKCFFGVSLGAIIV